MEEDIVWDEDVTWDEPSAGGDIQTAVDKTQEDQMIEDAKNPDIAPDEFNAKWGDIAKAEVSKQDKAEAEPTFIDKIGSNLEGVKVGLEKYINDFSATVTEFAGDVVGSLGTIAKSVGLESTGDALQDANAITTKAARDSRKFFEDEKNKFVQEFADTYGEDTWEWGTDTGDIVGSMIGWQKSIPKMIFAEMAHSASRNDVFNEDIPLTERITRVGIETTIPVAMAGAINKIFNVTDGKQLTAFGEQYFSAPKAEQARIADALDSADRLGVRMLDDESREMVLNDIFRGAVKSREEVGNMIVSALNSEKGQAKQAVDALYRKANTIASSSMKVNQREVLKDLMETVKKERPSTGEVADVTALLEASKVFKVRKVNMADLSKLRKGISKASTKGGFEHLGSVMVKRIDEMMDQLADASNIDKGIYREANEAYKDYLVRFKGKAGGTSTSGAMSSEVGAKVKQVLKEGESALTSEKLFGSSLKDIRMAKRLAGVLNEAERREVVLDVMLKSVKDTLDTGKGAKQFADSISNAAKAHPEALKAMLGEKGAKEFVGSAKLLSMINNVEDAIVDTTLAHDIRLLFMGPAIKTIHPLTGGTMMLTGFRNIAQKVKGAAFEHDKLIARWKKEKPNVNAKVYNEVLHGLTRASKYTTTENIGDVIYGEKEDRGIDNNAGFNLEGL